MADYLIEIIHRKTKPHPLYIEGKNILVSFAHKSSFIPVSESCEYISVNSIEGPLSYWDATAYCFPYNPHNLEAKPLQPIIDPEALISKETKEETFELTKPLKISAKPRQRFVFLISA
jgi:hypothetical protein